MFVGIPDTNRIADTGDDCDPNRRSNHCAEPGTHFNARAYTDP